ncbi:MAG: hypothetical protein ACXABY_06090 [Candidatus Thorarchaeota archaeon]|jgi:hypothetical protein
MCIAVYKEEGQPVQKKKMYKRCFKKNNDGAGFAWWNKDKQVWVVKKGLMSFKAFWRTFNRDNNKLNFKEKQLLVHFRVGTSGNRKGPDCTHPFPVTKDLEEMRQLHFETPNLVAHNGVIGPGFGTASDTMIGVRDYIDLLWDMKKDERAVSIWKELLKFDKCRWFMAEGKDVRLFGTWIKSTKYESKFSNSGYLPEPVKTESLPATTTGANFGAGSVFVHTQRYYRNGNISKFCNTDGDWSWNLWKGFNHEHYSTITEDNNLTSPNEMQDYVEAPASVMALLDKDGNILWDDDYSPAEDLAACPSCLSENLVESELLSGDSGCADCGCVFQADTGDIVVYDPSICTELVVMMQCLTCHEQVQVNEYGECPDCGTILDPQLLERRIKEQQNGR